MTVLQLIKEKQLTVAQEAESRLIFELATDGAEKMSVHQLKMCLQALNFHVLKKEAQALVYEFDYLSTNTIELADFQKIFLAKVSILPEHLCLSHLMCSRYSRLWRAANATGLTRRSEPWQVSTQTRLHCTSFRRLPVH